MCVLEPGLLKNLSQQPRLAVSRVLGLLLVYNFALLILSDAPNYYSYVIKEKAKFLCSVTGKTLGIAAQKVREATIN